MITLAGLILIVGGLLLSKTTAVLAGIGFFVVGLLIRIA